MIHYIFGEDIREESDKRNKKFISGAFIIKKSSSFFTYKF